MNISPPVAQTEAMAPTGSRQLTVTLFKNSAILMACRMATMLVSLLTVPFVIRALGLPGYGTWELLLAFYAVTGAFTEVLGGTLLWRASSEYGAGDVTQIRRIPRLGTAATLMIFGVTCPLTFAFRHSLVQVFHIPGELRESAIIILPLLVGMSILVGANESLAAVLRGSQQAGLTSVIQTAAVFVNAGIVVAGVASGRGLWSLLFGLLAANVLTGIGYYLKASQLYGWLDLRPKLPTMQDVRHTRRYLGLLSVGSVSVLLRGETDKLVLATFATPVWVGVYAIAAKMARMVMDSSNFFYVPTIAAAGALNGRRDWGGVKTLYSTMSTVFPGMAGLAGLLVLSLHDRLVIFWLGKTVPGITPILFLLVGGNAVVVMLTGAGTSICKGLGKLEVETTYVVVGLFANVVLTISLVLVFGAIGTVVASMVSWALGAILFVILLHKRFDLPTQGTYRSIGALLYAACLLIISGILIPPYQGGTDRVSALLSAVKFGTTVGVLYLAPFVLMNIKTFTRWAQWPLVGAVRGTGQAAD